MTISSNSSRSRLIVGKDKTRTGLIGKAVEMLNCFSKPKSIEAQKEEVIENPTKYDPTPELCALLADFPSPDPQDTVLHVVFRKPYSEELIVKHLLTSEKFSSQLSITNSTLALPLHIAVQNKGRFGDRVFDAILDAQPPGSLRKVDVEGSLPIHLACAAEEPSVYAIQRLVEAYPESLRKQSNLRYPYQSSTEQYEDEESMSVREEPEVEMFSAPRTWYSLFTKTRSPILSMRGSEFLSCNNIIEDEACESGFTPLHIAVLNHAPPEAVDCIIQADKPALEFKTSKGRTALKCAKSLVVDEVLSNDSSEKLKNSFATIELLEASQETSLRLNKLKKSAANASQVLTSISALGPKVEKDSHPVVCPEGFLLPPNLNQETIDIELPIGFFRIRHALCKSKSPFLEMEYYMNKMNETEVKIEAWDKFDDHIGSHNLPKDIDEKDFVGATRKNQRVLPKSIMVNAFTAYETCSIIRYDDYCFGFKKLTKNPEAPFGSTFEAHSQLIFVNGGGRTRMVCSMEAVFPRHKPLVATRIKNAMRTGCSDADVALGEVICKHSGN